MKIIKVDSQAAFDQMGADLVMAEMLKTPHRVNLSITAGRTPKGIYRELLKKAANRSYLSHVHYYNFDEIPYKVQKREGITISDLREMYLTPAGIAEDHIHQLDESNYQHQDARLAAAGGLDAILLGIGADGHYCGNLPGTTAFADETKKVACDEAVKQRISRLFEDAIDIPDSYVTMGPRSIMAANHLIMTACGDEKAEIIKLFVEGPVDENVPASILKLHPHLTLLVDAAAGKHLN